jgi:competence protein ComEA
MVLKPHLSIVKPLADGRLGLCKILCFSVFFLSIANALSIATAQEKLPAGPGRDIMKKVCSKCHDAENVIGLAKSREEWGELVGKMVDIGAQGSVDDFNDVVDYLTEFFPQAPRVNVNKVAAKEFETALGFSAKEAGAIVGYRGAKGNFKSIEDLLKVPGIDVKKVQARRDRFAF